MERINAVCKECGKPFSISVEEQNWLKERGFELFKRCKDCRKKRRMQKENQNTKS